MFDVIVDVSTILTPIAVVVVAMAPVARRRWRRNRYTDLERDVLSFLAQGHALQDVAPRSGSEEDRATVGSGPASTVNVTLTVDAAIRSLIQKDVLLQCGSTNMFALYSCSLSEKGRKYMSENKERLCSRGYKKLKVEIPEDVG